jgi:hypothetical protein
MQANHLSRFQKNSKTFITILFDTYISRHCRNNLKKKRQKQKKKKENSPKRRSGLQYLKMQNAKKL